MSPDEESTRYMNFSIKRRKKEHGLLTRDGTESYEKAKTIVPNGVKGWQREREEKQQRVC